MSRSLQLPYKAYLKAFLQTDPFLVHRERNAFHAKAKNERLIAAGWCCRPKLEGQNFTSSLFDTQTKKITPKSVPHVQHDYFTSFNQSNH